MSQKTKTRSATRAAGAVRCAVYTRKSTTEGLDREFNSLDAQREAAQAYIASQRHEGWVELPERYDDGGFTGGNLDRPALTRLLTDIQAGRIDCVVVQRVDRLSRSLLDFAKLMETFEKHRVSFVSVAQQLNSATSMGRLVLNVLLSFAQFEREMIAERTRDKIAATRRKGKWCGGLPVLGYDVDPRGPRLVINKKEAGRVRAVFALYLERGSLERVVEELGRRGWVNKRWQTRQGRLRGGRPFTRTSLYQLLTNVNYIGQIRHKTEVHPGEQAAIVEPELWQRVQERLRQNCRTGGAAVRNRFGALLQGLAALCALRLPHDSHAQHPKRQPALPLLRLPKFPTRRPARLPIPIAAGAGGGTLRGRADPGRRPRPGDADTRRQRAARSAGAARRKHPGPPPFPVWPSPSRVRCSAVSADTVVLEVKEQ